MTEYRTEQVGRVTVYIDLEGRRFARCGCGAVVQLNKPLIGSLHLHD